MELIGFVVGIIAIVWFMGRKVRRGAKVVGTTLVLAKRELAGEKITGEQLKAEHDKVEVTGFGWNLFWGILLLGGIFAISAIFGK